MAIRNDWLMEIDQAADRDLSSVFQSVLSDLLSMQPDRAAKALADPRPIHKLAYAALTPPDRPEYAGHYRGSAFASLETSIVASAFNDTEGSKVLALPSEVDRLMQAYAAWVISASRERPRSLPEALRLYGRVIVAFGFIHPFQDGNGHIQRLTFQYLIERAGFSMAPAWRIHPCPYGEPVHRALAAGNLDALVALLQLFVLEKAGLP
jgi:fido (protein-threonine AMPylation protein)